MLQRGSTGPFAKMWQEFLNAAGYPCGKPDGDFGFNTDLATKKFQAANGLTADGGVGLATFQAAVAQGYPQPEGFPMIPSLNFTAASRGVGDIDTVCIHTMEVPEKSYMAVEISSRFGASTSPQASTHFCCDDTMVVQNVLLKDVAWHAEKANRRGIGIEHAGYAGQSAWDWDDAFSQSMLRLSAGLTAVLCRKFGLPMVWLDGAAVKAGGKGITGHAQVNDAFKGPGLGHRDPGKNFPVQRYINLVQDAARSLG